MTPFCAADSVTVKFVWPLKPLAFPLRSISQVYGPAPLSSTWLIATATLLPDLTEVTVLASNCPSVCSPISMLPPSKVRPHSLTTLVVISSKLMILASLAVRSTWSGKLAGDPLSPCADWMTPWAEATETMAGAQQSIWIREGILS